MKFFIFFIGLPGGAVNFSRQDSVPALLPLALFWFCGPSGEVHSCKAREEFHDVEVCELLVRRWKPLADRLRPDDRMIAHTGFLILCRLQERSVEFESRKPLGTRERKQEAARLGRLAVEE